MALNSVPDEYRERISVNECRGCWLWLGALSNGYATVRRRKRRVFVHRLLYALLIAKIPKHHELHHTCKNPRCVNPEHMQPLTKAQHQQLHRDLRAKTFGSCSKGHPWTHKPVPGERRTCQTCRELRRNPQ